MIALRSPTFLIASCLFFLSGMLGLGYELVWIKKAALVVGASQIALSTVLTSFFLGLGLGSYFVGRWLRTRHRSPLFVYGLFELAIGIFALAFPWLFEALEAAYGAMYPLLADSGFGLFALRFLLLFALFLPPTFFMGGTLPLLLDGLVERDQSIGSRTSLLYGVNILGAVAGVLLTCYFFIPTLGMNGTSVAGGAGNLAIGLAAMGAFRRLAPIHPAEDRGAVSNFFGAAAFTSGLLAIAYQVCWARYFTLFNTGTVYLTAILLAVYLLALAAGSFLLAPLLAARWSPLRILSVVQGLVPAAALLTIEGWRAVEFRMSILGQRTPDGRLVPGDTLELDALNPLYWRVLSEDLDTTFLAPFLQVAFSIFIPVVLIGAGLPAVIAAASSTSSSLRAVAGRLLFWNTLGSSAGGFVAGYALLPLLGLHWTLFVLGLGSVALSMAAHLEARRFAAALAPPARRVAHPRGEMEPAAAAGLGWRGLAIPAASLAVAGAWVLLRGDITAHTVKYHGYGRYCGYSLEASNGSPRPNMKLTGLVEGPLTTAFVFEDAANVRIGSGNVCLAVAYKHSISIQAVQGHIPCLFYPGDGAPQDCLGICLGSGQSFGALLLYPIKTLDVVDISAEMVRLSLERFDPYNHGLAMDSRVKLHLDDGRHFVERAREASYDVISMEPPPPTADGVYSLYSVEFYRKCARILRAGGVFMQWLPLYRITPLDAKGIIKTQAEVFPETFVVDVGADDFMLVSYKSRPLIPQAALRERVKVFETERGVKGLAWSPGRSRHAIASPEGVLSLLVMGPADIKEMDAPLVYRDDNQILSYSSGDRWLLRRYQGAALSPVAFAALRITDASKLKDYFDPPLTPEQIADLNVERAASFGNFNVPDPRNVAADYAALQSASDPGERAARAIALATAFDGMLAKEEAYQFLSQALEALKMQPDLLKPEHVDAARRIVRNRLCAFQPITSQWLRRLTERHGVSPLLSAMQLELEAFQRREAARVAGYWFR